MLTPNFMCSAKISWFGNLESDAWDNVPMQTRLHARDLWHPIRIYIVRYEWDAAKNEQNQRKHRGIYLSWLELY